jgi:hypothetical protein
MIEAQTKVGQLTDRDNFAVMPPPEIVPMTDQLNSDETLKMLCYERHGVVVKCQGDECPRRQTAYG